MDIPVIVSFLGASASPALRADIERHAQRLLRFAPGLLACDVTVSRSTQRHRHGNRYRVHASARVPGRTIEVECESGPEDIYAAAHDAFDALRRQLEDHVRIRRGDTKVHAGQQRLP